MAIWQDLVSDYGFRSGYLSVRRFAYKLRGAQLPQARAVILTVPGEEGQVDHGSGPMVREPKSGKYRRTRLLVLTLGYSRKAVRLLVFRSHATWAELHEKAFRQSGGVPTHPGARQSPRRRLGDWRGLAPVVTAKPANGGQGKTEREEAGDSVFYPAASC